MNMKKTLEDRGSKYGDFAHMSENIDSLMKEMMLCGGWEKLEPEMRHALTMIAVKIGRILTGDPMLPDSWHDIAGYATLVEERLTHVPKLDLDHAVDTLNYQMGHPIKTECVSSEVKEAIENEIRKGNIEVSPEEDLFITGGVK